jgi:Ni,Fe-hydrogenase III component G
MTLEMTLEQLQTQLNIEGVEWLSLETNRFDGIVACEKLLDTVEILKGINTFYLAAITGLDDGAEKNTLQVLYHFCAAVVVVTLRVPLQRTQAVVASICPIFPYASPFERETAEMFGITFTDAPDTSRLFLPDDWSEGIYPMRKDAVIEEVHHDNTN